MVASTWCYQWYVAFKTIDIPYWAMAARIKPNSDSRDNRPPQVYADILRLLLFLLLQRANNGKREFTQLQKWMMQRIFSAWGIQIGPFAAICTFQISKIWWKVRLGGQFLLPQRTNTCEVNYKGDTSLYIQIKWKNGTEHKSVECVEIWNDY